MSTFRSLRFSAALVCFLLTGVTTAPAATLDFEDLNDGDLVTTHYPGLTFSNAVVLTAGISLNEFEFPPHSGANVVSDNGGRITISFASPVTSVSGFFTYAVPLTLTGFDRSNNVVATAISAFSSNMALSGDDGSGPNELLTLHSGDGISSVTLAGDTAGDSFVFDDLAYAAARSGVPEPSNIVHFLTSAGFIVYRLRKL